MDNKMKLTKWATGYVILLAVLLTVNYFIKLSVDGVLYFSISVIIFFGFYSLYRYKKITYKVILILIALLMCLYIADAVLTYMNRQEIVVEETLTPVSDGENVAIRHEVNWIRDLRDRLDYEKIVLFGKWVLDEKINNVPTQLEASKHRRYELYLLIILVFIITVLIFLIYRFRWLKPILVLPILFYVWFWYQFVDLPWLYSALYFAGVVAYFVMDHHDKLIKAHPGFNTAYYPARSLMLTSLVLGLAIVLVAGFISAAFPINQVNFLVDLVTPNLWGARSGYEGSKLQMYSLKETAFQGSGDILGGPLGEINSVDPLFWVKFDKPITQAVYLKSTIKDNYDGLKWNNNGLTYKTNYKYYLSNQDNIDLLTSGDYDGISGSIKINRKLTKTVTLFTPMGLYKTSLGNNKVYASAENEAFYKTGAFVKYLRDYDFYATRRDFFLSPEVDYLQVSNRVEPRTIELAKQIGSFGETDYQKMLMLTQFLSQNYTYSLTPVRNRERRDFVSSFLFDTKKGYCTYFASALVVMARINGIPARYVEGFRVDPGEVDPNGDYSKVTEKDAHAWAEVYIEGYGWMIFESTPIYSEAESEALAPTLEDLIQKEETTVDLDNFGNIPTTEAPIDLEDLLAEGDGGRGDFNSNVATEELSQPSKWTKWIVIGVLFIVLLILIYLRLPFRYLRRKNTHAYAIRIIYLLAYLLAESKDYPLHEPEYVFKRADYPKGEVNLWLKMLYSKPDGVTEDQVMKAIDQALSHYKDVALNYQLRKGKLKYLKFRYFDIVKFIP